MNDNNQAETYDLTLFEREAAAYESATEHYLSALHKIFSHTASLLRDGGLLKPLDDQVPMSIDIRLPWSYTLGVRSYGPGSVRYYVWSRSWSGRGKEFVADTAIFRDGTFDYSFSQEVLEGFAAALRLGFMDCIREYSSRDKKGRMEMLRQRRPSGDDNVEVGADEWDESEEDGETAYAA